MARRHALRLSCGLLSTFYSLQISVWESLEIRVPWEHEIVSSNLTTLTALRWSSCWYESRLKSGLAATTLIAVWPSGQAAPC